MFWLNNTGTFTCPADTTGIIYGCEGNRLIENSCVGVKSILYVYDVSINGNVLSVLAYNVVLIGQTGCGVISRPNATIREVLTDSRFSAS